MDIGSGGGTARTCGGEGEGGTGGGALAVAASTRWGAISTEGGACGAVAAGTGGGAGRGTHGRGMS